MAAHRIAHSRSTAPGFTIIEVMLVLATTGLLLVGVLANTFSSIAAQRYNDSVNSFASYLQSVYNEVASPESLGAGQSNQAVLGKLLVFGYPYGGEESLRVYSATIVGSAKVPATAGGDAADELAAVNASLFCGKTDGVSTVEFYAPLWQAELTQPGDKETVLKGSLIIFRAPTSGNVHTLYYADYAYDLADSCQPGSLGASTQFRTDIQARLFKVNGNLGTNGASGLGFCVKSSDAASKRYSEVRIAPDGRNSSAVSILNVDLDTVYDDDGEILTLGNQCQ